MDSEHQNKTAMKVGETKTPPLIENNKKQENRHGVHYNGLGLATGPIPDAVSP